MMTEELKEALEAAKTDTEAKEILANYKKSLIDEELNQAAGGTVYSTSRKCDDIPGQK